MGVDQKKMEFPSFWMKFHGTGSVSFKIQILQGEEEKLGC
jgi:hypothetical protein